MLRILLAALCLVPVPAPAETITVAVAANFARPMHAIVKAFEAATQHEVRLVNGASGKLYAQILNGAPYDALLSADQAKPQALLEAGAAVAESRFTYAIGLLVLWSATPGFIDADAHVLQEGRFNKLALANPALAPYGVAAEQTLRALNLDYSDRYVMGENIAQTYHFVRSGNAQIGFVAASQVDGTGSSWPVPQRLYAPIKQDAVLLNRSRDNKAAEALLAFLQSPDAAAIIRSYGYLTPAGG